jgi:hypothetical protein
MAWQLIGGIILALAAVVGVWYGMKSSASSSADRDAALAREKLQKDRQDALTQQALDVEREERKKDATNPVTNHADFLRNATGGQASESPNLHGAVLAQKPNNGKR